MKHKNQFDELIGTILNAFYGVEGSNLIAEDKETNEFFFRTLIGRKADLDSFIIFFIQKVMPLVHKSVSDTILDVNKSKYSGQINKAQIIEYVNDTKYEFVRMGYVLVFHKFENYAKAVLAFHTAKLKLDEDAQFIDINKYSKDKFNFRVVDEWHKFKGLHDIQFICNCTKHQSGYCVTKYEKPNQFEVLDETSKINRTQQQLKADTEFLSDLLGKYNKLISEIVSHIYFSISHKSLSDFNNTYQAEIQRGDIEGFDLSDNEANTRSTEMSIKELMRDMMYAKYL